MLAAVPAAAEKIVFDKFHIMQMLFARLLSSGEPLDMGRAICEQRYSFEPFDSPPYSVVPYGEPCTSVKGAIGLNPSRLAAKRYNTVSTPLVFDRVVGRKLAAHSRDAFLNQLADST
jgi:hypothetical protein